MRPFGLPAPNHSEPWPALGRVNEAVRAEMRPFGFKLGQYRIIYKNLDGSGYVDIPSELLDSPTFRAFLPPRSIEGLQTIITIVDCYNTIQNG